eukprot:13495031-Alexandrium_andersonii.AAC.1
MSASLVGSEMCIRDRGFARQSTDRQSGDGSQLAAYGGCRAGHLRLGALWASVFAGREMRAERRRAGRARRSLS